MSDNTPTALYTMVGGDDDSDEGNAEKQLRVPVVWDSSVSNERQQRNGLPTLELCLLDSTPEEAAAFLDHIIASARPEGTDDQAKCELVDFLPDLAAQLANHGDAWSRRLKPLVNSHLLRIVEFALQHPDQQVVKTGHVSLLRLLEHGLISSDVLEHRIWPILLDRIAHMQDTDTLIVDTIHLMNRMMGWLGDEQTERVVVPSLDQMSLDSNVAVRRVCTQLYGDFCAVVSITCAEKMVPPFLRLCEDVDLVVRKTCAEVFMSVSSTVSLETRKVDLAPAFEKLLADRVRWVSLTAYQTLGPFITTFAEPSITILDYNQLGELVLKHPDGFESKGKTSNRMGEGDDDEQRFSPRQYKKADFNLSFQQVSSSKEDSGDDSEQGREPSTELKDLIKKRKDEVVLGVDGEEVKNGEVTYLYDEDDEETMAEVGEEASENYGNTTILVLGNGNEDEDEVVEEEIPNEVEEKDGSDTDEETDPSGEGESEEAAEDEDLVIDHVEEIICTNTRNWSPTEEKDENFNTFQFWREPLPNIDTELETETLDNRRPSRKSKLRTVGATGAVSEESKAMSNQAANESYVNNNPIENASLRPVKLLRPPRRNKDRSKIGLILSSDQGHEFLFRDHAMESPLEALKSNMDELCGKVLIPNFASSPLRMGLSSDDVSSSCNTSIASDHMYAQSDSSLNESWRDAAGKVIVSEQNQNIVPTELVKQFVSMSKLAMNKDYDNDLAHHCAYNLPAVVLTLGPSHWDILKPAYLALAEAMDWKVRRTAASCIHELAVIVGEEVATNDLVPVFHGFIKDLDEVRVAALKHLAHFIKLLRPDGRDSFLPLFTEFLAMDNQWRWRFREELAAQLLQVLGLFSPADTCLHLSPVVMSLLLDRVSDVRKIALQLATELVSHVSIDVSLLRSLLVQLAEQFAHSSRWNRRQTFALLCSRLVSESVLSGEMFARDVLPHLLDLSWDRVPNVRLTVARALASDLMAQTYFTDVNCPHHEVLIGVLKRLQTDRDKDVRYFASQLSPNMETAINSLNSSTETYEVRVESMTSSGEDLEQ